MFDGRQKRPGQKAGLAFALANPGDPTPGKIIGTDGWGANLRIHDLSRGRPPLAANDEPQVLRGVEEEACIAPARSLFVSFNSPDHEGKRMT
jgi:hypothetical protein